MPKCLSISLFGATGFVGRYIVRLLAEQGHVIKVAARRPKEALHLKPAGDPGQIALMPYQGLDDVDGIVAGSDVVIGLAGILFERRTGDFMKIHRDLPARIAESAAAQNVKKLVHISAVGADTGSRSRYAKSKGEGEEAVLGHFPNATILRPSIIFGPEDNFYNQFADLARISPFLPLIGGGHTKFQPVYVEDVAKAVDWALTHKKAEGEIFELGGPNVYTFKEIMQSVLDMVGRKRMLLTLPTGIARIQAWFFEKLPTPLLTRDQLILLEKDNVVAPDARGFADMRIAPEAVEAVMPRFLKAYSTGQPPIPVA